MIIAIPENQGEVNQHFGRSTSFAILELNQAGEILKQETIGTENLQHQHSGIAKLLKDKGVETVIVGGIGGGAIQGLEAQGLKILYGATGAIGEVAKTFGQGNFVSQKKVCNHHGEHGHSH